MRTSVPLDSMGALISGTHENPFDILGPHEVQHQGRRALAVRAYLPQSDQVWVLDPAHGQQRPMRRIHPAGLYEAICTWNSQDGDNRYRLRVANNDGKVTEMHDPYSFPSLFTEYDFHLLGEGTHYRAYRCLGAHLRTIDGVQGTNFAVWAPNAASVSVICNSNSWDDRTHAMRKHVPSGIWELFVPELGPGELYKYRIKAANGEHHEKCDPYGFAAEVPPKTASVVTELDNYTWSDDDWLEQRRTENQLEKPMSVYEVHLGSWRKDWDRENGWYNYRELAHQLVEYCHQQGYTHLELMPVSEHPFTGSWGYQTVGYFSATSRYGSPEDFMYFVDHCHQNGIGVILDWVPAHFPKDGHGLANFDGSPLYEHADPRQGEHPDWGTKIFNYGRNEVRSFLISNTLFWLDKYHIDGLRVDAVASMLYLDYSREDGEWVPNEQGGRENTGAIALLKDFNINAHQEYPGVLTIAEESTAWGGVSHPTESGGLGFSLKWNMGWMNDTLRYMKHDPIHRSYHHGELTFSLIYAFTENFTLPLSHDEVVHGKGSILDQMPGDLWQRFANVRLLYSYMWTHPGKKLLFMGNDIAQWNEWSEEGELQWDLLQWDSHRGIQRLIADLNRLYREQPALHEVDFDGDGFEWIDCDNWTDSTLAYMRKAKDPDDFVVVCTNFTPVVRHNYRIGVPREGFYGEIFNSDSEHYAGSNIGNHPGMQAEAIGYQGRPWSISFTVPPMATVVFKRQ